MITHTPAGALHRLEDRVEIDRSRALLTGAPAYDPELVEQQYLNRVYDYYGYRTPFWDQTYRSTRPPRL